MSFSISPLGLVLCIIPVVSFGPVACAFLKVGAYVPGSVLLFLGLLALAHSLVIERIMMEEEDRRLKFDAKVSWRCSYAQVALFAKTAEGLHLSFGIGYKVGKPFFFGAKHEIREIRETITFAVVERSVVVLGVFAGATRGHRL